MTYYSPFNRRLTYCNSLILALLLCLGHLWTLSAQTIWINWSDLRGNSSERQFGSNDQAAGSTTSGPTDLTYANLLSTIGIKFLRLHNASLVDLWTTNSAWDQSKIAIEYNAPYITAAGGSRIIQNIPKVPAWCLNTDGTVNTTAYAGFCADLVRIVNINLGKGVKYWEPMNEFELSYYKNDWAGLFALYNQCATAMKAVDPTIKVGGVAFSWRTSGIVNQFLTTCWSNIDFISWHRYMTSSTNSSGVDGIYTSVMSRITVLDDDVSMIRTCISTQLANGYPSRTIELAMDEINIPSSYTFTGWGQQGYVGATFFASSLTHLVKNKINIATSWSAKDGTYGMISSTDTLRPAATVYQWANNYLIGAFAASGTDDVDCEVLPIYRGSTASGDTHAMLLTNKDSVAHTITLKHGLPINQYAQVTIIDDTGVRATTSTWISSTAPTFTLNAFSCALITMP